MYHQFSRLTLVVTSSTLGSGEIDDIEAAVLGYQANLIVKDGLSKDTAEEQAFTWDTAFSDATVTSDRRVVYTGGESMTKIKIASVTLDGYERKFPVPAQFDRQLEPGKSYTLTISFKMLRWARSNIYWDDVAKTLTFVSADGTTDYERYLGVFFKWGSLVGISPAQVEGENDTEKNAFSGTVPIYVPYDYPAAPKWKKTTGDAVKEDQDIPAATDNWNGWASVSTGTAAPATHIPFMDGTYAKAGETPYGTTDTYVIDAAQNATYKGLRGDICQYLSLTGAVIGNYRLPMAYEIGKYTNGWGTNPNAEGWAFEGTSRAANNTLGHEHGTVILIKGTNPYDRAYITNSVMGGVVLPVTGLRNNSGTLGYVGNAGYYWSGSAYSGVSGYYMNFNSSGMNVNYQNRAYGYPVRCVVN
jgi:hypothetical protein